MSSQTWGSKLHRKEKGLTTPQSRNISVSERPHRPAFWPYYAAEQIVRDRGSGLFGETATRALLHTVSMFPIGFFLFGS